MTKYLTPKEYEICQMATTGMSNRQIAQQLKATYKTIETSLHRAYSKLGVTCRTQLVFMSLKGELRLKPVQEKQPRLPKKYFPLEERVKVGDQHGCYEVLSFLGYKRLDKKGNKIDPWWQCRCVLCGREKPVSRANLLTRPSQRCWDCNLPIARKNLWATTFYGK